MSDEDASRFDRVGDSLPFNRRGYLKIAAGIAGTSLLGGSANAQTSGDYDTITVQPGDTYGVTLGSGDTFENKLIDISASGATFTIYADGGGWAVRNVGIKGVWDQYEKSEPFIVRVDDGETGVIENFYFADGAPDDVYPGVTGIFVPHTHAGVLKIDRVNIQALPDNAIYASGPGQTSEYGHSGGYGGEVHITNSYAADCRSAHFRIGSDGSYCKNCVAVGGDRGFIGRFENTRAIDCDFSGGRFGDVVVGSAGWETSDTATVTVENTRFETSYLYRDGNELIGQSAGTPRTDPPDSVPLSAEAAAGGDGSAGSTGTGGDTGGTVDDSDGSTATEKTLVLETNEGGPLVEYEFTVDGTVTKGSEAELNDSLSQSGGTTTVTGAAGNGYADSYAIQGTLTDWRANVDTSNYRVLIDGQEIDPTTVGESGDSSDGGSEHSITVRASPDNPDAGLDLSFTVDGPIEFGGESEPGTDRIVDNGDGTYTATSISLDPGAVDSYTYSGTVVGYEYPAGYDVDEVTVDGEATSFPELVGAGEGTKLLAIDGTGDAGGIATYDVSVTGTLEYDEENSGTADGGLAWDRVTDYVGDGRAVGVVGNGTDVYRFTGSIDSISIDGTASATVRSE